MRNKGVKLKRKEKKREENQHFTPFAFTLLFIISQKNMENEEKRTHKRKDWLTFSVASSSSLRLRERRTRTLNGAPRIPRDQMCLFSLTSTRTSFVPIAFSANFLISFTARGACFLKELWGKKDIYWWSHALNLFFNLYVYIKLNLQ